MKQIILAFFVSLLIISCTDPDNIGLEIQPDYENIIITNVDFDGIESTVLSEDSLRSDETLRLVLGEIYDPVFGHNQGSFYSQLLLSENNVSLGNNPIVDSAILSFSYSGYYGDLDEFTNLEVNQIQEDLYKDSSYYSNHFSVSSSSLSWVDSYSLTNEGESSFLRIKLNNNFAQQILDLGENQLQNNETFLEHFKGISVYANAANTMLYLNPTGNQSKFTIYYHNDNSNSDTLALNFQIGGDAASVNVFNEKQENELINNNSNMFIQSMAGYKSRIEIKNLEFLKEALQDKALNRVTLSFSVKEDSQNKYLAHEKLFLSRIDQDDNVVNLIDYTIEGESHYGGRLEDDKYVFNITRYFSQLLNNSSYTSSLLLFDIDANIQANRTILDKEITLTIYYSQL